MSLYLKLLESALLDELHGETWTQTPATPFPERALTMVERKRLHNVAVLCEEVLSEGVPGDFMECGVWRGGCSIMMRAVIAAWEEKWDQMTGRQVWVADSFQGVPEPTAPQDAGIRLCDLPQLAVPLPWVKENFAWFGLLDDRVRLLPGWFKDTLPGAGVAKIAVLRLDGDLYESTMDCLNNLWSKVSEGGYVIIDDYNAIGACKLAVDQFRKQHGIESPLVEIDRWGVYWRRALA